MFQKIRPRYPEAAQLQQEIAALTHSVVDQGRELEGQAQWTGLPITAASASEALALALGGGSIGARAGAFAGGKNIGQKERGQTEGSC